MKFEIDDAKKEFKPVKVELVFETLEELVAFNKAINLSCAKVDNIGPDYYRGFGSWDWESKRSLWMAINGIIYQYTGTNGRGE